jgi:hypothetical protein
MATMRIIVGLILVAVAAALAINTAKSLSELPDRDPWAVAGYLFTGFFIAMILGYSGMKRICRPGAQSAAE